MAAWSGSSAKDYKNVKFFTETSLQVPSPLLLFTHTKSFARYSSCTIVSESDRLVVALFACVRLLRLSPRRGKATCNNYFVLPFDFI